MPSIISSHDSDLIPKPAVDGNSTRRLSADFEHGLKLVQEKTGRNRFFITRKALTNPEDYIAGLIK